MSNTLQFTISRRADGVGAWTTVADSLPGAATNWSDDNIAVGKSYEYRVARIGPDQAKGFGYVLAGIEAPFPDDPGGVVVVVDKGSVAGTHANLDRLENDLRAEGWTVEHEEVDPGATPVEVRSRLQAVRKKLGSRLKAALLIGEVPQPYSGLRNPDGHMQHRGAWPADTYYADLDGVWTDTQNLGGPNSGVLEVKPDKGRPVPMINMAGDGKFDQDAIPSDLEIAVGRIDARNMPGYAPLTPVDLINRYLENNHNFRVGREKFAARTTVTDLLGVFGRNGGDPLARMAWRDGTAIFGTEPIEVGPKNAFFAALEAPGGAGLAFAISYGHVDGNDAIGLNQPFRDRKAHAFFLGAFGSFFGDWSTTNNLLRDAIFHPGVILGANWCNWPNNHYHQLGANWTIGETLRRSFNNELGDQTKSARGIHSGLMGDPTLRYFVTRPPSDLCVERSSRTVTLNWRASPDEVIGYHVYRSSRGTTDPEQRITKTPVQGGVLKDLAPDFSYRVVAVQLITNGSGTFFNHSPGAMSAAIGAIP